MISEILTLSNSRAMSML